jgi:type I restriction enzyme M protein
MPSERFMDRTPFRKALKAAMKSADLTLTASLRKAIESALSEQDDEAAICTGRRGVPEYDSDLRDYENVPLGEDVPRYVEREVTPYVSEAWVDESYTDEKDGGVGRVGYEINFNRYFYEYEPPRPLAEIEADIRAIEKEIVELLGEVGV